MLANDCERIRKGYFADHQSARSAAVDIDVAIDGDVAAHVAGSGAADARPGRGTGATATATGTGTSGTRGGTRAGPNGTLGRRGDGNHDQGRRNGGDDRKSARHFLSPGFECPPPGAIESRRD
jgi:hypothetical protein